MKTRLDCLPCLLKQALAVMRLHDIDKKIQKEIIDELCKILPDLLFKVTPVEATRVMYQIITKKIGLEDPYKDIKSKSNELILNIYEKLKHKIEASNDRLLTALELAVAGNIIDYGAKHDLDIDAEIDHILQGNLVKNGTTFNYTKFKQELAKAKTILYLGDNAGEIVFDRLLIEEIKAIDPTKKIIYAAKEKPIINDALVADAYQAGLDKSAEIISCGSDGPGTLLSLCTEGFKEIFYKADLIISKGQGNYEALSSAKRPIFFLLKVKCKVIANHGNWNEGDIILHYAAPTL